MVGRHSLHQPETSKMPQTLFVALLFFVVATNLCAKEIVSRKTHVRIVGDQFWINDKPTYAGRIWNGKKIEGLLMNSRMVQSNFDDLNPETRQQWAYPDTQVWDAARNTQEFLAAMLVDQRLAGGVGAAHGMTHAALLLGVARLAGLGLELANHEAAAIAVGVELTLGGAVAAAKAGIASAGLQ